MGKLDKDNYKRTKYGWMLKLKKGFFNKFTTVGTPAMGNDTYNMASEHKNDMITTLGITDFQLGGKTADQTATEAQIIQNAAVIRVQEKKDRVGDFVVELIERLAAMKQKFGDKVEYIKVADEDLDEDFQKVLEEEYGFDPKLPFLGLPLDRIQDEYDFEIDVEDMIPVPKAAKAAQLDRRMAAIGSNAAFTDKFMTDYDIGKVMEEMFELDGIDLKKFKKGGPVKLGAVMENRMFQIGMEVPAPHESDDHDEHIIIHRSLHKELKSAAQQILSEIQRLQLKIQKTTESASQLNANPGIIRQAIETATAQVDQLTLQLEPIEQMLRQLKIHMQGHNDLIASEEGVFGVPTQGVTPQSGIPSGQPTAPGVPSGGRAGAIPGPGAV
jgi:hypothetical protein